MTNWIEWKGGECPIKSDKTRVNYKLKSGFASTSFAKSLNWTDIVSAWSIIAYRITEDHEPMTREEITAQIETLQKQLDAMPVVKRVWYASEDIWRAETSWSTHYFDIETINGVPHIHGIAMKEIIR